MSPHDELIAIRKSIHDFRRREAPGFEGRFALSLLMAQDILGNAIMCVCPHGRETWRIEPCEIQPETSATFLCDSRRAMIYGGTDRYGREVSR
jgi:hypothetical protein